MKHVAYIGIGSNLGRKQDNCNEAVSILYGSWNIELKAVSNWYRSKAQTANGERQPSYINGAVKILTTLSPFQLLKLLKKIEIDMGLSLIHI